MVWGFPAHPGVWDRGWDDSLQCRAEWRSGLAANDLRWQTAYAAYAAYKGIKV